MQRRPQSPQASNEPEVEIPGLNQAREVPGFNQPEIAVPGFDQPGIVATVPGLNQARALSQALIKPETSQAEIGPRLSTPRPH